VKRVTVRFNGGLERHLGLKKQFEATVSDEATLLEVQDLLGIPRGEVGLFVVAGELMAEDAVAADHSTIDLFPMFGGG
jgi:hypothetical protein